MTHSFVRRLSPYAIRLALACIGVVAAFGADAVEVEFVGKMGGRALLQVDGGRPRTVAVGAATPEGIKLLALDGDRAVVDIDGRQLRLVLGSGPIRATPPNESADLILQADSRGHFVTDGAINGASLRFLVDTGASLVSLGAGDAQRAGIDFRSGTAATSLTAAGPVRVWRVHLNSIRIGSVTLHNVEAAVHEDNLPVALLGMSVLNRFEMRRQGGTLTLRRGF